MKIADIRTDTVYWYDTRQDWGTWLATAYDRGPVKRVDDKRYNLAGGSTWSRTPVEDPKGRHVKVVTVLEDGSPDTQSRERVVPSTHIRDTMENVRRRYDARVKADREAEARRQARVSDVSQRAEELRRRLAALDLDGAFRVGHTTGQGRNAGQPKVTVEFTGSAEGVLSALLHRLEAAATAYQDGYAVGDRDAEAARRKALGYISIEEEVARDRHPTR